MTRSVAPGTLSPMGQYRIEITAVGGHGCNREVGDGATVTGCGSMTCPDCLAAKFVADLRRTGNTVEKATLTHWPGTPTEVVDEFKVGEELTGWSNRANRVRHGKF